MRMLAVALGAIMALLASVGVFHDHDMAGIPFLIVGIALVVGALLYKKAG